MGNRLLRWLGWGAAVGVSACVAVWIWLQVDRQTLPGLRLGGEPLPRSRDPAPLLNERAKRWGQQQMFITTGAHLTRASRHELGAWLDVPSALARAQRVGRSGDPIVDVWVALETTTRSPSTSTSSRGTRPN